MHKNPSDLGKENVTAEKYEREKRAKTRENGRLTYPKLKKSKIFEKVLDKGKQVWYNKRRELKNDLCPFAEKN